MSWGTSTNITYNLGNSYRPCRWCGGETGCPVCGAKSPSDKQREEAALEEALEWLGKELGVVSGPHGPQVRLPDNAGTMALLISKAFTYARNQERSRAETPAATGGELERFGMLELGDDDAEDPVR